MLPSIVDGEDKSSVFGNCIRNNYRHIRKWAKRTNTDAFRIYDKEIGRYPFAIDFYAGRFLVHYFPRKWEEDEPPAELAQEVEATLKSLFDASKEMVVWKSRIKREKLEQYEKIGERGDLFVVHEYGVPFYVNITDYLDTGLFLDHREMRRLVATQAKSKTLLNLFAYTCSFTVHAALSGAISSKSVDLSNTYTEWGRQNFKLNGIDEKKHVVVRADCLKFLEEEVGQYDLIVIDPPTLSRSKAMSQMFDVQLDYPFLIQRALNLLLPGGTIFFSTNSRRFVFDETLFPSCHIKNITSKTHPIDFRDTKIHHCWTITR